MATKSVSWNTGTGNILLTYTGQGNGTIVVSSDPNTLGNARSQTIIIETTQGGVVTKNLTISQAACPVPVGSVNNFSYTGTVQNILLPAGSYKLQCWGAQGGSNAADPTYSITAQAGGKGGYSEGVLTLSSPTTVYVFVGGQGSSSGNGGWNGGGGGTGSSSYDSGGILGVAKCGGGGGATDIALTTSSMTYSSYRNNRSSASLLSRIIVAGGGSGGSGTYRKVTTTQTNTVTSFPGSGIGVSWSTSKFTDGAGWGECCVIDVSDYSGTDITIVNNSGGKVTLYRGNTQPVIGGSIGNLTSVERDTGTTTWSLRSNDKYLLVYVKNANGTAANIPTSITMSKETVDTSTTHTVGYVGGGTTGDGYSDKYKGKQNAAGTNGAFGFGANQQGTTRRHVSGCGGGGWYGGGADYGQAQIYYSSCSGGGSGWVNTSASASNRPSGYTGLQLDSGSTTAGSSSFPAPSSGNETGHAGNGYARITRLS